MYLGFLTTRNDPQDLEKEERMERTAGLLDRYVARKRKRHVNYSGESDAAPVQSADPSQPATKDQSAADGSSGTGGCSGHGPSRSLYCSRPCFYPE